MAPSSQLRGSGRRYGHLGPCGVCAAARTVGETRADAGRTPTAQDLRLPAACFDAIARRRRQPLRLLACRDYDDMKAQLGLSLCLALFGSGMAQTPEDQPPTPQTEQNKEPERWNLFYQATAIGQRHRTFRPPYEGDFSLSNYPERDV